MDCTPHHRWEVKNCGYDGNYRIDDDYTDHIQKAQLLYNQADISDRTSASLDGSGSGEYVDPGTVPAGGRAIRTFFASGVPDRLTVHDAVATDPDRSHCITSMAGRCPVCSAWRSARDSAPIREG